MWSSDSYEHILFMKTDTVTEELLKEAFAIVRDYMEPILVRKGSEAPEPNHMYSYLTIAILSEKAVPGPMRKAIRKFKYEKGYKFNMRGFSQAHIICASMEDETVFTNFAGRGSKKVFQRIFQEEKHI